MDSSSIERKLYEKHAALCETLANPKRLEILSLLREGEKTVGDLAKEMGIPQPNLSQHLAILRDRGIVAARKEGVNSYYSIANPKIIQACDLIREVLYEQLAEGERFIKAAETQPIKRAKKEA